CLLARPRMLDLEPLFREAFPDDLSERRLVVDEQQMLRVKHSHIFDARRVYQKPSEPPRANGWVYGRKVHGPAADSVGQCWTEKPSQSLVPESWSASADARSITGFPAARCNMCGPPAGRCGSSPTRCGARPIPTRPPGSRSRSP